MNTACTPTFNSPPSQERGSVLVVCVGVLAILSLMAVAFLTTMQLQRTVGKNAKYAFHAEIATKNGLADALSTLIQAQNAYYFEPSQSWYTRFNTDSDDAVTTAEVFPTEYGISKDSLEHAGYPFGRGKWSGLNETGDGSIKTRYAVAIVDLSSMVTMDCNTASSAWSQIFEKFGNVNPSSPNLTAPKYADTYNTRYLSINHAAGANANHYASFLTYTSPWGMPSDYYKVSATFPFANTELSPINTNTARNALLDAMINYAPDQIDSLSTLQTKFQSMETAGYATDVYRYGGGTTDNLQGGTLSAANDYALGVKKALTQVLTTPKNEVGHVNDFCTAMNANMAKSLKNYDNAISVYMETAINDVLRAMYGYGAKDFNGDGSSSLTAGDKPVLVPDFYAGPIGYFYIAIRGQAVKGSSAPFTVLSEKNMEAVVYVDLERQKDTAVIYQRWFTR